MHTALSLAPTIAGVMHYRVLPALLRWWPCPVWRTPALLLTTVRFLLDPDLRRIAAAALRALGYPSTWAACWRFAWLVCYHREVEVLLHLQATRLSDAWAGKHLGIVGSLPAGGAVLVLPHHANMRLALVAARSTAREIAVVSSSPDDGHTLAALIQASPGRAGMVRILRPEEALRKGLRVLRAGGYLVIMPDATYRIPGRPWPTASILGRMLPLAPGPVWLAQRTRKPIVPLMVVPARPGWRVWCGEPIAPAHDAVAHALEACIRRSPVSWSLELWRLWLAAPGTPPGIAGRPPQGPSQCVDAPGGG